MKAGKFLLGLTGIIILLSSCSKYEEGPGFSLYSKGKRAQGNWYFGRVMYNDVDSSEHYVNDRIQFTLEDNSDKDKGFFTWMDYSGTAYEYKVGWWSFIGDKDSLEFLTLIETSELFDTTQWKIMRLAYDEWWIERAYNDTTTLRWELWKSVYY